MSKLKKYAPVWDTLTGYDFTKDEPLRPLKAIRTKCLECQGGVPSDVRRCRITDCPVWPYRSGTRPKSSTVRQESEKGLGAMAKFHRQVDLYENLTSEGVSEAEEEFL